MPDLENIKNQMYGMAGDDYSTRIEKTIKDAYRGPMQQLIGAVSDSRRKVAPSFFKTLDNIGTGAGDMSPAAALSTALNASGRSQRNYDVMRGLQDYYDANVNDIISKGIGAYQNKYNMLSGLYGMGVQDRAFNEDKRRYDQEWDYKTMMDSLARSGGGGGGGYGGGGYGMGVGQGDPYADYGMTGIDDLTIEIDDPKPYKPNPITKGIEMVQGYLQGDPYYRQATPKAFASAATQGAGLFNNLLKKPGQALASFINNYKA